MLSVDIMVLSVDIIELSVAIIDEVSLIIEVESVEVVSAFLLSQAARLTMVPRRTTVNSFFISLLWCLRFELQI